MQMQVVNNNSSNNGDELRAFLVWVCYLHFRKQYVNSNRSNVLATNQNVLQPNELPCLILKSNKKKHTTIDSN